MTPMNKPSTELLALCADPEWAARRIADLLQGHDDTRLEREHRRYIDASRLADNRRVEVLRLKDGLKTIADGELGSIEEAINFANTLLFSPPSSLKE